MDTHPRQRPHHAAAVLLDPRLLPAAPWHVRDHNTPPRHSAANPTPRDWDAHRQLSCRETPR